MKKRRTSWYNQKKQLQLTAVVCAWVLVACFFCQHFLSARTQVLGLSTKLDTQKIVDLLNLERAKKGLGPLSVNEQLDQAAIAKGENMFSNNYWAHVGPDGTQPWSFISGAGYAYQSAGENLARDFTDEQSLLNGWLASATHKANILNGNFSETGVAVLDGEINGEPVLLIVNLFAQPLSATGQAPEIAIYQQDNQGLVLAGEVLPVGQLTAGRAQLSWSQWLFVGGVLLLASVIVYNLSKRK
ncbi:MAG: CAP domain-containing protein [bacterium]|nr:CAP domain-containing protein [bacterium]